MNKKLITIVRYVRKPMPSCNWSPRYCEVWEGKTLLERRLGQTAIQYGFDDKIGYECAENIVHDYRKAGYEWDDIHDLGEVELTIPEFKRYETMFKASLSNVKARAKESA